MYVCVCMYVCMYVCFYVCMYLCMYVCKESMQLVPGVYVLFVLIRYSRYVLFYVLYLLNRYIRYVLYLLITYIRYVLWEKMKKWRTNKTLFYLFFIPAFLRMPFVIILGPFCPCIRSILPLIVLHFCFFACPSPLY